MKNSKSVFLQLSREEQKTSLEALIFAADEAVSLKALHEILLQSDEKSKLGDAELFDEDGRTSESDEEHNEDEIPTDDFDLNELAKMIAEINDELSAGNRP